MSLLAALLAPLAFAATADSVLAPWGKTQAGELVQQVTLVNDTGMRVRAISWGATLTAIEVPDRAGRAANIVLSLPDIAAYERSARRWAGVVGRYAGRIDKARFTLDGVTHRLEPGRNGVTLHGGSNGYDHRVWQAAPFRDRSSVGVTFRLTSSDGDQGFPGRTDIAVTYRLARKRNELRIEYVARVDRPSVMNLTNHGFFNLAGAADNDIADHRLRLVADRQAEVDARKIPTGRLLPLAGTPLDFRSTARIGDRLAQLPDGIDHSLTLPGRGLRWAARLEDAGSGRRLDILTDQTSLQLNSGGGFDGSEVGGEGVAYRRGAGIAIETQHLPDSPNRPAFPSTRVAPSKPYRSVTVLRFSTTSPR